MTYCAAMMMDKGLVFGSDSRTNAGVDNISIYSKMKVYERPGDRVIVILTSGNLSITQATLSNLDRRAHSGDGRETLWSAPSMFDVASVVGDVLREVQAKDGPHLIKNYIDSNASFLVGGQILGEEPRLFHVYAQGNFVEATQETPYFQIGEAKYGKPIIDRLIRADTDLTDAAKCLLVSFDSTMRSNISVGLPIDLVCYRKDSLKVDMRWHILESDPYFNELRRQWSDGIRDAFSKLSNLEEKPS